ncbi:hypothetical protein [Sigmofec virus UA08Rod_5228]|uniref:Uncharacterized protein n=1 Tax=Sigmofec virus UA08Rod_5228 TaxID=2929416 RepID=A0A976N178_9VIRU|nr:hypothetical protein [Sigmofec virus UA08Rod_5228]
MKTYTIINLENGKKLKRKIDIFSKNVEVQKNMFDDSTALIYKQKYRIEL